MAYMKNIDLLLREKIKDEAKLKEMKNYISLFLRDQIDFEELPFKVKLFLCEWEAEKNCEELNTNVVAQLIVARRSGFERGLNALIKKIKNVRFHISNLEKNILEWWIK